MNKEQMLKESVETGIISLGTIITENKEICTFDILKALEKTSSDKQYKFVFYLAEFIQYRPDFLINLKNFPLLTKMFVSEWSKIFNESMFKHQKITPEVIDFLKDSGLPLSVFNDINAGTWLFLENPFLDEESKDGLSADEIYGLFLKMGKNVPYEAVQLSERFSYIFNTPERFLAVCKFTSPQFIVFNSELTDEQKADVLVKTLKINPAAASKFTYYAFSKYDKKDFNEKIKKIIMDTEILNSFENLATLKPLLDKFKRSEVKFPYASVNKLLTRQSYWINNLKEIKNRLDNGNYPENIKNKMFLNETVNLIQKVSENFPEAEEKIIPVIKKAVEKLTVKKKTKSVEF